MPEWYYVGLDKCGMRCSNCCDGFSLDGASCVAASCYVLGGGVGGRDFICKSPNPNYCHIYKWTETGVDVYWNDIVYGTNDPGDCFGSIPPYNSCGRTGGSSCSQSIINIENICVNGSSSCSCPPSCPGEVEPVCNDGIIFKNCVDCKACEETGSTTDPVCACPEINCSLAGCVCEECDNNCIALCPNDPANFYNTCLGSETDCPCHGETPPTCTECQTRVCVGETFSCESISCDPACEPGYSCSCGTCRCTTESTCCQGSNKGWEWSSDDSACLSCGDPARWVGVSSNCCDADFKQKGCNTGEVCCADGNCYDETVVFCMY